MFGFRRKKKEIKPSPEDEKLIADFLEQVKKAEHMAIRYNERLIGGWRSFSEIMSIMGISQGALENDLHYLGSLYMVIVEQRKGFEPRYRILIKPFERRNAVRQAIQEEWIRYIHQVKFLSALVQHLDKQLTPEELKSLKDAKTNQNSQNPKQ